jgi:hypothetical protein
MMAQTKNNTVRSRALRPLVGLGTKVAAATLKPVAAATVRPLAGAASVAIDAGVSLERRALDLVLDSDELERIISTTLDSPNVQAAFNTALASDGAKRLITDFFESDAFDELVDGLLASDALWRLIDGVLDHLLVSDALWRMVDEVAASPSVTAAITQQSVGFAGEVRDGARTRSRRADEWLARIARRRATPPSDPLGVSPTDPPAVNPADPLAPNGDGSIPGSS